jgi:hypothetical protein
MMFTPGSGIQTMTVSQKSKLFQAQSDPDLFARYGLIKVYELLTDNLPVKMWMYALT